METRPARRPLEIPNDQGVKLIFELTNLCNFTCSYCIREEPDEASYLPVSLIKRVLEEVEPYHTVNFIAFTGGETTLHPEFEDIVRCVTDQGYHFGFVTNGWNFAKKTFLLIQAYKAFIPAITFSIDGASETMHDTLRGREGSYRRIMQAITLCKFNDIPVHLNFVVMRTNRHEVEEMAMLASRLGCRALYYGHCQPTPDAIAENLVLNAQERREVEAEVAALQQLLKLDISLAGDHYTPAPFHQCPQLRMREFNIDYRGYLTACCMLSGYRDGTPDTDVIADLNEVPFFEAHKQLLTKITQVNLEKIDRLAKGNLAEKEHFICTHCLEHYGKVPDLDGILTLPVVQPSP